MGGYKQLWFCSSTTIEQVTSKMACSDLPAVIGDCSRPDAEKHEKVNHVDTYEEDDFEDVGEIKDEVKLTSEWSLIKTFSYELKRAKGNKQPFKHQV